MARISKVGLGWSAPDQVSDWYADIELWYDAEKGTDYGSLIEAICKGDIGGDVVITGASVYGAWAYADPSVYYDYTNQTVIPFFTHRTQVMGSALDFRLSGVFLKTNGISSSFDPITTSNARTIIEDCRIIAINPSGSNYAVRINGAGSLANADIFLRCVISRINASNALELVKQAQASGFGILRNCVLDAGIGKYADGSNNVGLEVSDCVGLGSAGYDATSLILNTSSSEDASGSSGLTSIDNTALSDYANDDFRSAAGGPLDVTGTNTAFIGVGLDAAAGDAITLTPFSSTARYIFNREIDGSDRAIDVSINLTGDPSGGIQWRLIDEATNNAIVGFDWSTFLASPAIGSHTVAVDVPTSIGKIWYKLQLRFTLDTGINAESVLEFAVGVIVVDNGQSNSQYRDTLTSSPPVIDPDAAYCTTAGWQTSFSTGNGAIAKANALVALLNVPVGYYNNGLISQALPYFVTGNGWDDLTGIMANHFDNYFELMSFDQGETDARTAVTTATYQTNLQTLRDNILSQMSRPATEFNFAVCLGGNSNGYNAGDYTDSSLQEIRTAKENFVAANVGATLGHRIDFPLSDSIHHSPATYELIAAREIEEYSAHLGLSSDNRRDISSAQLNGDELTVNYSSGDALTKIGTGGASMVQVSENSFSTLIAITATVVNTNNVVHTLASTPTGQIDVRDYYGIDIDVSTRQDLVFPSTIQSDLASSTLNLTVTGIPDGSFMTVLDQTDGTRLQRQSETYASESVSILLTVPVGTTVKGYVDDNSNPSTNGAYIEGITE